MFEIIEFYIATWIYLQFKCVLLPPTPSSEALSQTMYRTKTLKIFKKKQNTERVCGSLFIEFAVWCRYLVISFQFHFLASLTLIYFLFTGVMKSNTVFELFCIKERPTNKRIRLPSHAGLKLTHKHLILHKALLISIIQQSAGRRIKCANTFLALKWKEKEYVNTKSYINKHVWRCNNLLRADKWIMIQGGSKLGIPS